MLTRAIGGGLLSFRSSQGFSTQNEAKRSRYCNAMHLRVVPLGNRLDKQVPVYLMRIIVAQQTCYQWLFVPLSLHVWLRVLLCCSEQSGS